MQTNIHFVGKSEILKKQFFSTKDLKEEKQWLSIWKVEKTWKNHSKFKFRKIKTSFKPFIKEIVK